MRTASIWTIRKVTSCLEAKPGSQRIVEYHRLFIAFTTRTTFNSTSPRTRLLIVLRHYYSGATTTVPLLVYRHYYLYYKTTTRLRDQLLRTQRQVLFVQSRTQFYHLCLYPNQLTEQLSS